ncbi:MAG: DUF4870 domain-containing protein [Brooklawnia sp.]|jgi:uncharacterized Tic20 family protein
MSNNNHPALTETRMAATLAHLAGPISSFVSAGWLAIVGPLVAWLIYKDRSPSVRAHAAEAFNFQVTMWLAAIAGGLACLTVILLPLGVVLILGAVVMSVVMGVIAALKAANDQDYHYPWALNLLQ